MRRHALALISHWDPYPFILLNLLFSTQAAYAAPLILLAQNRQDERDRENIEHDRAMAARTQAEAEFLARELAAVRLALAGMATADDVSSSLKRLESLLITGGARDNAGGLSATNPADTIGPAGGGPDGPGPRGADPV